MVQQLRYYIHDQQVVGLIRVCFMVTQDVADFYLQRLQCLFSTWQPVSSLGLIATTTSRQFLLAYPTLASSMPANYLQDGGACVEVSTWCSPSLSGWPVCAGPLRACIVASNCIPWHLGLWSHTPGPPVQLRRQWTTNMVCQNTRYDFVLLHASSQGPSVSAVVGAIVTVQQIWRRL